MLSFKEFIKEEIGPHENKELSLMLQGKKPAALFYMDKKKFQKFLPHIQNGRFIHKEGVFTNSNDKFHIVAQQGEEDRMNELHSIFSSDERPHRRIGELLGYKPEDIEHFMSNLKEGYLDKAKAAAKTAIAATGSILGKMRQNLNKKDNQ